MKQWNLVADCRTLSTTQIVDTIFRSRQILDPEKFLHPTASYLIPFEQLSNIDRAKDIIVSTIQNGGKFFIYGDVDADGCTSTAIMYRYLKHFTDKIVTYINKGKEHGISENFDPVEQLKDVDTLIIVDSIDDNPQMYDTILSMGKKLVILDHHIPTAETLSKSSEICLVSSAIDNYPNPHLSGAGVCWKMCAYLDLFYNRNYAYELTDLACTGIIADMCDVGPTSMENRFICYHGFTHLNNPAIKQIVGDYPFNSKSISFSIAPLVNAANRIENNQESLELFLLDDPLKISDTIDNFKKYKEYQKSVIDDLCSMVLTPQICVQEDRKCMYLLVNEAENLRGVIATKVSNEYSRPVIVLSEDPEEDCYRGSMRSFGVENFQTIINDTGLATCNGHEMAAGITIPKSTFIEFINLIEEKLIDFHFEESITADIQITVPQVSYLLVNKLTDINLITGSGFKGIKVLITGVDQYKVSKMSQGKHLKVEQQDGFQFIMWNFYDWDSLKLNSEMSFIGSLEESKFNRKSPANLIIEDFKYLNG